MDFSRFRMSSLMLAIWSGSVADGSSFCRRRFFPRIWFLREMCGRYFALEDLPLRHGLYFC